MNLNTGQPTLKWYNMCFSQDFSSEKTASTLKNVKCVSIDRKEKMYSIILKDNSFLSVKYNIVEAGEYNATYSFIKMPREFYFENNREHNLKFLLDNISYFAGTIGLNGEVVTKIKAEVKKSSRQFDGPKPVLIPLNFIKGYDECSLSFTNKEDVILCTFFFRRLL